MVAGGEKTLKDIWNHTRYPC